MDNLNSFTLQRNQHWSDRVSVCVCYACVTFFHLLDRYHHRINCARADFRVSGPALCTINTIGYIQGN